MIVRGILVLLFTFFLVGCYKLKNPPKPKNLIPKEKMINILIDIRLMASATGVNKRTLDNNIAHKEEYIYNKYNIDSLQFALSNEYYVYHIEIYDDIYAKVKDSLDALKNLYKDLEEKELKIKQEQDSLKALVKRDSLNLKKSLDSIGAIRKNDSLTEIYLSEKIKKEGLIDPVSDNDGQ
ncbi:DUF4296 domain-containing protein [Aestuariivivens sediminis]|uniref:DUF4296 domain-containing protein n=1 Tax=Aestuariivivens sediminis TaxID=2913557 RepID=UPI001F56289E|nr:DUF4296 domain-containing protein [Aestuariivivens sediminis]